jgi:hypothetical protein
MSREGDSLLVVALFFATFFAAAFFVAVFFGTAVFVALFFISFGPRSAVFPISRKYKSPIGHGRAHKDIATTTGNSVWLLVAAA